MSGLFVLDPDDAFRTTVTGHCSRHGLQARAFCEPGAFFSALDKQPPHCIILEMELDDACGLDIQDRLARSGYRIPLIFTARRAETSAVVRAIKRGAQDVLVKPVPMEALCKQVHAALKSSRDTDNFEDMKQQVLRRMRTLTSREHEVLALALTGKANKEISRLLDISPRTVETHRGRVLAKLGLNNLLELAHIFADLGPWPQGGPVPDEHRNPR